MEIIKTPFNDQSIANSAFIDYSALSSALVARGENYSGSLDGIERWTRTYAARRNKEGELVPLPSSASAWYFVICNVETNKLFVWVGNKLEHAGRLNTAGYEALLDEGKNIVEDVV